ncbi:hypothetical protein KKG66_07765, partial [bacterium]|nr:hypothetical protein [bacterium]
VPYRHDATRAVKLLQIRQAEQRRMREYMTTKECLMLFLRRELDDPDTTPCGQCANCRGEDLLPVTPTARMTQCAQRYLKRGDEVIEPRRFWASDALEVHGWKGKIAEELRCEEGRSLCRWGDSGWGVNVREGKLRTGQYDDELVKGAGLLIRERWNLAPAPGWVTCVPSLRHPELVPDLARRIAHELKLPFVDCVSKLRKTEPQKEMQNSYQQSHNLAGSFTVDGKRALSMPVLLVDDMVDSRWTFTVIGALLREAGSGPVYPFALAKSFAK